MPILRRASAALAAVTAILLGAQVAASSPAIRLDRDPAWRQAATVPDLTGILNRWLDGHSPYPRRADPVTVRLIDRSATATLKGSAARMGQNTRGLYDPDTATIWLVAPWSPKRAGDVAVLLHELVHHRQQGARHWYCPGAQEPDAYGLQDAWLAERGLRADVNRIALVLEAGCTRRDIHPD